MMPELMLDTCKYAQCPCWPFADNVIRYFVTTMLPFGNSKTQDCVTKTIRDPFTTQFTYMPRGKVAHVAATFPHIEA
jgi:hypothetical protein